jgi:antitoxin component YwqK of YwqJK toxin-antitoxin module
MKRLLLIVLPLLLIVGCSKEPINYETTLIQRKGVFYTKDTNKPYSGPFFSLDKNGRNKREGILEDGIMITYKDVEWYKNGQKEEEVTYKDGKKDGLWTTWYENGQKIQEVTFKNGKMISKTEWKYYENGQKEEEKTFKDGKQDGLWTMWYENGQKMWEGTYRDGEPIGLWTNWDKDGSKSEGEMSRKDNEDGRFWEWDELLTYLKTYKDGKLISQKEWYKDGSVKE